MPGCGDIAVPRLNDGDMRVGQAVQAAGIGIFFWDVARDRIELSESGRVLHGLAADAVVNYQTWLLTLHADDRETIRHAIHRAWRDRVDCLGEYRVVHSDGSVRWISCKGRGCFDDAGNPSQLTCVLFDVTAHKQAEQALREQRQALAHMARVSALGGLSAALAHELNQPLTAILCNAQAGLRFMEQDRPDYGELRAILTDIAAGGLRAGSVVSRLRGLFKKDEATQQTLNINALVEEVVQLLRSDLVIKQISPWLHLGRDLPETMGDAVQLRQVLLNLLVNGAEAAAASETRPRQLQIVTHLHDASNLEVAVRDSGHGIAPPMLEQIFDPFVSAKSQGLGMGLAISRAIVVAHGGRLWAENAPEGGAILRFTLPIIPESRA